MNKSFIFYLFIAVFLAAAVWFTVDYFYSQESFDSIDPGHGITDDDAANLLGNLPLSFQKNEGQVDDIVEYLVKNGSTTIFFTPEEVVYSIVQKESSNTPPPQRANVDENESDETRTIQVIRQAFVNANTNPEITGHEEQEGKVNYFIGNDPDQWVKNASTYGRIVYEDLYNGIDLHYSGKSSLLKYAYHVEPGVDYKQIAVAVEGAEQLILNPDGTLVLETKTGNLGLKAPETYQMIKGQKVSVASEYVIISDNQYGFTVGEYDPGYELVIDPYTVFSTYLASDLSDQLNDVIVDGSGNIYVVGSTESLTWPGSTGYDLTHNGGQDVVVSKLNSTGTSGLIFSTYIGGTGDESGNGIILDGSNQPIIVGTSETGYPTTGGVLQPTRPSGGLGAPVISKLNAAGTALVFSTYFNHGNLSGLGIDSDSGGNLYIAGIGNGNGDFTGSGFDLASDGDIDGFIGKVSSDGTTYLGATFIGGTDDDAVNDIAVDSSDNVYVVGFTRSTDLTMVGGAQTVLSGETDGFLLKTNSSLSSVLYSTYIGGSSPFGNDSISNYGERADAVDVIGDDAVVVGQVYSADFPTVNAADASLGGSVDSFVTLLDTGSVGGGSRVFATYLGGSSDSDLASDVTVDGSGNIYVVGGSASSDFFTTANAVDSSYKALFDLILTKYDSSGNLTYSSFYSPGTFAGSDNERALGVFPDSNEVAHIVGFTRSSGMATSGVIQPSGSGGSDGLVLKMTTINSAPDTPTLVTPAEAGTATSTTTNIVVNLVDLDVNSSITADIRVSTGSSADCVANANIFASGTTSAVSNGQNASFQVTGLSNGATYTVCYRAYDGSLYSDSGNFIAGGPTGFTVNVPTLLEYSTFLGGSAGDSADGIDVDGSGDIYLFGSTTSSNFPTTGGVFQPAISASGENGFVSRISPDGNGAADLVFSTFIGGTDCSTEVWGGKVDASGNSYFTGYTCDTDYPVASGFQAATTDQFGDAIFTKMTSSGDALFYSTYIGADGEYGLGYTLELFGTYAYIVGETYESSFPVTVGAFDTVPDGEADTYNGDAFLTIINHNVAGASSLEYSTFLGSPTTYDYIQDVAIDGSGNAYLVGGARASDFPTTVGAYDSTFDGGFYDLFVAVLDPSGNGSSDLLYSTLIGGTGQDRPGGIAIDGSNIVHISGRSDSTDYPTTVGAYDTTHSAGFEWVISKLNPAGTGASDLVYSTYISATGSNDDAFDIEVGSTGDMFVVGRAADVGASNFPTTGDAFDSTFETTSNGAIVQISPDGNGASDLIFSSLIGGSGTTVPGVMSIDASDNIYIAGGTSSAGYQTTTGAYDETINGSTDAFAMKLAFGTFAPSSIPIATYLGGSANDLAVGVGLDTGGNIIVGGEVQSNDFPVTNELQSTLSGTIDTYIVKLDSTGSTALVSTYFGGSANDTADSLRVDSSGNVYLAGDSTSTDLFSGARTPAITGPDGTGDASSDVFVVKLNEALSSVLYGTYLGGSGQDIVDWKTMEVDDSGKVYLGGYTFSTDFPVTANAFDSTGDGTNQDGFAAILDTTVAGAGSLVYATYIGGVNGYEVVWGLDFDASGNMYVGGESYSSDFTSLTAGAFDTAIDDTANGDGYLIKIDPNGTSVTSLAYGTMIGGSAQYDSVYGVAYDDNIDNVYLCGSTYTSDLPVTLDGYQQSLGGAGDTWVYQLDLAGNGTDDLVYGTYLGGTGDEWCDELKLDDQGALAIFADSDGNFPTTGDAFASSVTGGYDSLLIRFNPVGGGGSDLVYASYYGGSGGEFGYGTYLDTSVNQFYITGSTASNDIPLSAGAYSTSNNGGEDGYVAALVLPDIPSFSAPSAPTDIFIGDGDAQSGSPFATGLTSTNPVFSAICNDADTGDIMDQYQIQVDDTDATFANIIWDSGQQSMNNCIAGNRSQNIIYGGVALDQDGATYYVRIKFWDDTPTEGVFSSSSDTFTMASPGGGGGGGGSPTQLSDLPTPVPTDVEVVSTSEIQYIWQYSGANHSGFRIYDEQAQQIAEITDVSARIWTQTGLEHNTKVTNRTIRSYNSASQSSPSQAWPDATTHIIPVEPVLVSRLGTEITIKTLQSPNNLDIGESGIQYELTFPDGTNSSAIIESGWEQTTSYTFIDIPVDVEAQVRVRSRNQDAEETDWSDPLTVAGEEIIPTNLLLGLGLTTIDGQPLPVPIDPNQVLFGAMTVENTGDQTATDVFVNLPIPEYLQFVPSSLVVENEIQSDSADQDSGQGNTNAISTIFSELVPQESRSITFQLVFDVPALTLLAKEQIQEDSIDQLDDIRVEESIAAAILAANPILQLQASVNASNIVNPVFSNSVSVEPNLSALVSPSPTPTDPPSPVSPPTLVSPPTPTIPPTTPSTPGTTNPGPGQVQPPTGQPSDNLFLTGNAVSAQEDVEFTGTTSQPNSTITVTFNNVVTRTVTSNENGIWQVFISADELGITPGESVDIEIIALAEKDDVTSNTVVQNVTVTRAIEGEVVVEIDQTVSEESFIQTIIEEQEEVIETTLVVAAPVILASSLPLWGYLPYLPTLLFHLISWLLGLFGKDKKGRLFGIVYDSITKQPLPLAIVRVYDAKTKKLVKTEVTNKEGRYEFLLEPGQYTLEAKKPTYLFPSKIVSGSVDGDYQHVYNVSAGLNVAPDKLALPDLPLDPQNAKRKFQLANIFKKLWIGLQAIGHYLALPMLFIGALISIISVVTNPENIIYWILAIVYVLMLVLQLIFREHKEKAWGIVYEVATNAPLPLVSLQLVDPEFGKVVKSRLSDYEGRFSFLPEPGKYVIKANKQGYMQPEVVESRKDRNPLQGEVTIEKEGQRIDVDIAMKQ